MRRRIQHMVVVEDFRKAKKGGALHFPDKSKFGRALCGTGPPRIGTLRKGGEWLAERTEDVTCRRCLHLIGSKTTEQGTPENSILVLIVRHGDSYITGATRNRDLAARWKAHDSAYRMVARVVLNDAALLSVVSREENSR